MEQEIEQKFRTAKVRLYARHDSKVNRAKFLENSGRLSDIVQGQWIYLQRTPQRQINARKSKEAK
jgi:hypothetical protein